MNASDFLNAFGSFPEASREIIIARVNTILAPVRKDGILEAVKHQVRRTDAAGHVDKFLPFFPVSVCCNSIQRTVSETDKAYLDQVVYHEIFGLIWKCPCCISE